MKSIRNTVLSKVGFRGIDKCESSSSIEEYLTGQEWWITVNGIAAEYGGSPSAEQGTGEDDDIWGHDHSDQGRPVRYK